LIIVDLKKKEIKKRNMRWQIELDLKNNNINNKTIVYSSGDSIYINRLRPGPF